MKALPVLKAILRRSTMVTLVLAIATPRRAAAGDPPRTRRLAVVVGANEPAPGRQALRYAQSDAQLMADVLVRVGRFAKADVQVLLEPRPGDVLAALDAAARELQSAGPDSLLLFYYSGHSDGQRVFPHGETLSLSDLRDRIARSTARVRVAILDTCRGGGWTRTKGLTVGPPLDAVDLMNVATEGTALLSSSSGLENAHEAGSMKGSFFTHHVAAGLLGAADKSGDGNVTLQEVFEYAKERTVRDSARMAAGHRAVPGRVEPERPRGLADERARGHPSRQRRHGDGDTARGAAPPPRARPRPLRGPSRDRRPRLIQGGRRRSRRDGHADRRAARADGQREARHEGRRPPGARTAPCRRASWRRAPRSASRPAPRGRSARERSLRAVTRTGPSQNAQDPSGPQPARGVIVLGSVQALGYRPLPLVQVQLTRRFSLDAYASWAVGLRSGDVQDRYLGGATFAY